MGRVGIGLRETRALQCKPQSMQIEMRAAQAQEKVGLCAMRELRINTVFMWKL